MKIEKWAGPDEQMAHLGKNKWRVSRLIELAKALPVMDIPLDHLNVYYTYDSLTLRELVMHMKAAEDADLSFPIILDEDGDVMDGRHRIMKAIWKEEKSIKAVRFQENPAPCQRED